MERLLLFEGFREVEVIETCQCNTSPKECLRLPALKTFFPDSPLEFTVDVGKCSNPSHVEGMEMVGMLVWWGSGSRWAEEDPPGL